MSLFWLLVAQIIAGNEEILLARTARHPHRVCKGGEGKRDCQLVLFLSCFEMTALF